MKGSTSVAALALLATAGAVSAQTFSKPDPALRAIWREGMENSQVRPLAQTLLDSIGPRLTGTPGIMAGNQWLVQKYGGWGIDARNEQYGTWTAWQRGITHLDLLEPRVRTLEGTLLAWSPGTDGPVTGSAVLLPQVSGTAEFERWLPQARGKFVLVSHAEPSCRPMDNWEKWATPETLASHRQEREAVRRGWGQRVAATGLDARSLIARLEQAGVAGILSSRWSEGWGVNKVFNARTRTTPVLDLSCEDYGLVFRLAENNQGPVLRLNAEARSLGERPVFNTIAVIPGSEKPNEYVLLSAHFDTWDAASGATDNGTGTVTMMEAMRILKKVLPRPKRTILVGHWSGEEQGLNGSRAFAEDHPEIVRGIQAVFNQDNGTGRIANISMQGFAGAGKTFRGWVDRLPREISRHITLHDPGNPGGGGSDYASFVCHGAPAFNLSSLSWDYGTYTWHTNRDTFDKIAFDEVKNNATLTAMLAYMASEEPERISRERVSTARWPTCSAPARSAAESRR